MTSLPPFELHRPRSVEEASDLLQWLGEDAVIYSGGTELLLVMKLGFGDYGHLVDVKGIAELRALTAPDGFLEIGAAVTHREVETAPVVRERWPALVAMERGVGNLRVRAMGTMGGNLCFADPHSDPATFLLAAGGTLRCRRGGGAPRELPVEAFVRGPFETALEPCELLTAIRVPELPAGAAIAHRKLALHERPAITVACRARVEAGAVGEARLAVGSVGNVPLRVHEAEGALAGAPADGLDRALAEAAEAAAAGARPMEDANGSVEYKRQLVRVLSARVAREAIEGAASPPPP